MLIRYLDLLFSDPVSFAVLLVTLAIAFMLAISVHEFGHALVAYRLGDSTAKRLGRLSLDPRVHLDPTGTAMLLVAGFGWGKPVPVNPARLRNGRLGMAYVAVAGPGANLILAFLLALPVQMGLVTLPFLGPSLTSLDPSVWIPSLLAFTVLINVLLAVFNLLPLSPLDGSQILLGVAPRSLVPQILFLQRSGPVLLIMVVMGDIFFDLGILGRTIGPVINWATGALLS